MNKKENEQKNLVIFILCLLVCITFFVLTSIVPLEPMRAFFGVFGQIGVISSVIMVVTNKKRGFLGASVLYVVMFLMTLLGMIRSHSLTLLPNAFISVASIIILYIIYSNIMQNDAMHNELNKQYEQLMDSNRLLQSKDEALKTLAYKDQLTSMYNKTYFCEQIDEAIKQDIPFTIIYADMDNFKVVDDTFGPEVGDSVLMTYAERISSYCNKRYVCARTGGDEFGILLTGQQNESESLNVIEQLRRTLGEPLNVQGQAFSITSSYGIASYPQDSRNTGNLLNCSIMAVYRAKANGKDRPCFFSQT